ncbi:hypothetical protein BT96DRAFT_839833 [Gymnopus androsaceus JB14]|uniref:C3H1-type domain-containing protein n=1 Tax=Gymnopus androsaceus JB14 TaxID=1447944 RepID=A0A6A4GLC7_9AGAR|nr:hypothetical protein BT96DRAFT_839833 [Gymnopus androsaceus JB14]
MLKRRKKEFAWNTTDIIHAAILSPAHENVQDQVQLYNESIKEMLKDLDCALGKPEMPDSLWKHVCLDRYVNLDKITSNSFAIEADRTTTIHFGDHSLELPRSKPTTKISNHGQWINAFMVYQDAALFAFKGCNFELKAYFKHINNLFACTNPVYHQCVINYDKVVQIHVGKRRDALLNEFEKFSQYQMAHLESAGVAITSMQGKSRGRSKGRKLDACRNWNNGNCSRTDCRYKHVCINCGSDKHVDTKCPSKECRST